jgi:hypothetical protein
MEEWYFRSLMINCLTFTVMLAMLNGRGGDLGWYYDLEMFELCSWATWKYCCCWCFKEIGGVKQEI